MDRLLLDTNALLDIAVGHRLGAQAAQWLFDHIADNHAIGYVFPGSLKDFYFITRRDFSEETRRAWISLFLDAFLLASFDRHVCEEALSSDEPDYEDGLIRSAAECEGCQYLISRDETAFATSVVIRLTPEEYIRTFSPNRPYGSAG